MNVTLLQLFERLIIKNYRQHFVMCALFLLDNLRRCFHQFCGLFITGAHTADACITRASNSLSTPMWSLLFYLYRATLYVEIGGLNEETVPW